MLWGSRVVVPPKGRSQVLKMVHEAHPGIVRMKGFARGYVWWPGIDEELEKCVKSCVTCQVNRKSPPVAPLYPWSWPDKPWLRIHVDYASPFFGKLFLLMVDAHSKWLEVHISSLSSSTSTISMMRKSFGMKKLKDGSLETKLSRFLFKYRLTPQSSTGISPSEMMFGRRIRSQLDNLHPDLNKKTRQVQERQKKGHDIRARPREFQIGELVYVRNYGQLLLLLKIVKKIMILNFQVQVALKL